MGGRSSEHDISIASGRSVLEGLAEAGFDAVQIEISREGRWELTRGRSDSQAEVGRPGHLRPLRGEMNLPVPTNAAAPDFLRNIDVVFPVLHGPFGEDGTVQGALELAGIAYVGPGVAASSVAMDKDLFKTLMRGAGVPVTQSVTIRSQAAGAGSHPAAYRIENPFGLPVVVKPARLGSSVGITIVRDVGTLENAVELAFEHDEKVLVEEFVRGTEIECSVLGNANPIASAVGEIVPLKSDWYDFASKYDEDGMELVVPARITAEQTRRAQEVAIAAFLACDCEGMARVDMFVRDDGEVLVNELNTIPGFTATSVYAKLFESSGIGYAELLRRLVELAVERHDRRSALRY
jgi:D-alanine-D-alanine ligase